MSNALDLSIPPQNFLQYADSLPAVGKTAAQATKPNQVKDFGASAIIALVSAIVGTAVSAGMTAWQTKKQNQYNKEMLDAQNEYNSPEQQMQRLAAAGLNPMAFASQGGVSQVSSDMGKKEAPNIASAFNTQSLLSALSLLNQVQVNKAQIRNLDASAELKQAQALTEAAKKHYYQMSGDKAEFWRTDFAPSQIRNTNLRSDYTEKEILYADDMIASKIDLNKASAEQKHALKERYKHLNTLTDQQVDESINRIALYQAQIQKIQAEIPLLQNDRNLQVLQACKDYFDVLIKDETEILQGHKADTWLPEKISEIVKKAVESGKDAIEIYKLLKFLL